VQNIPKPAIKKGEYVTKFGTKLILLALLVSGCSSISSAQEKAADEIFSESDLVRGKSIDKEVCGKIDNAVWVEHRYGTECIRFYPSPDAWGAVQAVFFFHGDRLDGRFPISSAYKDNTRSAQMALAARHAASDRVPVIVVARPGTYGSSGNHAERRRPKEFHSLNAAVDAIKEKLGIGKVILAGQSGGATAVGALLTLGRTDVKCAIAASGGYAVLELAELKRAKLGYASRPGVDVTGFSDSYNVIDFVGNIKADPDRRIFIVGDPGDRNTVFTLQKAFADKVAQAGHDVTLVEAAAIGRDRHNLNHIAFKAAGWCATDLGTEVLKQYIGQNVKAIRAFISNASSLPQAREANSAAEAVPNSSAQ
jgi:pimeloyl-ACP methyl ester carboxylesterase